MSLSFHRGKIGNEVMGVAEDRFIQVMEQLLLGLEGAFEREDAGALFQCSRRAELLQELSYELVDEAELARFPKLRRGGFYRALFAGLSYPILEHLGEGLSLSLDLPYKLRGQLLPFLRGLRLTFKGEALVYGPFAGPPVAGPGELPSFELEVKEFIESDTLTLTQSCNLLCLVSDLKNLFALARRYSSMIRSL